MKVTIAYLPGEERKAQLMKALALGVIPGSKVRKSDRHDPFLHIYIATTKPKNRCGSKENT